jgi:glycerophosphoryl diester phosphodiesterase
MTCGSGLSALVMMMGLISGAFMSGPDAQGRDAAAILPSTPSRSAPAPATLHGGPPILIAHRGASGELPEHTMAAYQLAVEQGADFIEPDLVLTKDGVLIARHENEIGTTTNVADHPEFADRKTTKIIDGERFTGWFTEDFTLAEIRTLRARERLPALRGTARDGEFAIPTFEEILTFLAQTNQGRARPIGVYPETKHPSYFNSIHLPHEGALLGLLARFGYQGPNAPVFIQSFEVENLRAIRAKSDLPLIQLVAATGGPADRPDLRYADMLTPDGLQAVARYATGLGPDKALILPMVDGALGPPTRLVADAHAAGLQVHPWTIRRENIFLPPALRHGDNPAGHGDVAGEIAQFLAAGVDGIFTDNVSEFVSLRDKPR